MKILLVNDDSIHAPGIALLAQKAVEFGDVWVVAPASQCSAMSQKLTLSEKLTVKAAENFPVAVKGAWQVGGTPVDCVKVALDYILEEKPDIVFSGINNGYNTGFDTAYSGTLGAAFEALRFGIPAIAFSAANDSHLEAVEPHLAGVIAELLEADPGYGNVWNVNFPALRTHPLMGTLRDRTLAKASMYSEHYIEESREDGTVLLNCTGIPTPDEAFDEGSDALAVRQGYISIGKVRAF